MITAAEALKITKTNNEVAYELEMIDEEICKSASSGESCTWWYSERLTGSQTFVLCDSLRKFGYYVNNYVKQKKIYISWKEE